MFVHGILQVINYFELNRNNHTTDITALTILSGFSRESTTKYLHSSALVNCASQIGILTIPLFVYHNKWCLPSGIEQDNLKALKQLAKVLKDTKHSVTFLTLNCL